MGGGCFDDAVIVNEVLEACESKQQVCEYHVRCWCGGCRLTSSLASLESRLKAQHQAGLDGLQVQHREDVNLAVKEVSTWFGSRCRTAVAIIVAVVTCAVVLIRRR